MENSRVALAIKKYREGNYSAALEIYKSLGNQMGKELFLVNIRICEKRLDGQKAEILSKKIEEEMKTRGVEEKNKNNRKFSYIETEILGYSFGEPVYADGHETNSIFFNLSYGDITWDFRVEGYQEIDVFFNLKFGGPAQLQPSLKEVVAMIEFFDERGSVLNPTNTIPKSRWVNADINLKFREGFFSKLSLPVPANANHLRISAMKCEKDKEVFASTVTRYTVYKNGVSVIIPSCNGSSTIRECLDSLAAQTLAKKNFEVIIVLNGEPDGTENILSSFRNENPEINLLITRSEVLGVGAARNQGLSLATRQFVTFIDDDDFVSKGFLQGLLRHSVHSDIVIANIKDFNEFGFFESPINQQIDKALIDGQVNYERITSAITLNACKLVPTSIAKSIKYNNLLKSGEDVVYFTELVCFFKPSLSIVNKEDNAIYYRRIKDNSISRQPESFEFNVKQRLEVVAELEKLVSNDEMKVFIISKVNAQLGFINRYLLKNPNEWLKFKEFAERLDISGRTFQYVNEKQSRTLVISYCFPPYIDAAGIVCAKRIIQRNKPVDVISNTMKGLRERDDSLWDLVKPFIGNFQEIQSCPSFSNWKAIEDFCKKVVTAVERDIKKYTNVYSRSMWPGSHFAAALLKKKFPKLRWVAEFSDPLLVDVRGQERFIDMDTSWLDMNGFTKEIQKRGFSINANANLFYWCEMLPYIFSDKFIFTNESQKAYMLNTLSDDELRNRVETRALVSRHPILSEKFYRLSDYDYPLDNSKFNIGYFGSFYATRGVGDVIKALSILPDKIKDIIRVHIFTPSPENVNIDDSLGNNILVNKILPYLDFLAVSKSFDALLVNDAETKNIKWINPYLPSKLSDYIGSGAPVWALCEEGSELDRLNITSLYFVKSRVGDIEDIARLMMRMAGLKIKNIN